MPDDVQGGKKGLGVPEIPLPPAKHRRAPSPLELVGRLLVCFSAGLRVMMRLLGNRERREQGEGLQVGAGGWDSSHQSPFKLGAGYQTMFDGPWNWS